MEARLLSIKGDSAINPQLPCLQCQTTSILYYILFIPNSLFFLAYQLPAQNFTYRGLR